MIFAGLLMGLGIGAGFALSMTIIDMLDEKLREWRKS